MKKFYIITILIFIVHLSFLSFKIEAEEPLPVYNLSVSFDTKTNLLKGSAMINFPEDTERLISTFNLQILSTRFNGQLFVPEIKENEFILSGKGILEVTYVGQFKGNMEVQDLENIGVVSQNIISENGVSLTLDWYPYIEGMALWNLKALIPHTFIAISESDDVNKMDTTEGTMYSFHFPYPLHDINLVAGPYIEQHESYQGIDLNAYFFPEDISLADDYLKYTKKYISLYEELLGSYPYKRFSIVENILPTGYSMPTFTLLGSDVVHLPFIKETSLGHEILHQWLGNSVYVDYENGNWVEGITSYLSDHYYEAQKNTGWQYRKKILTDYQSYVTPSKEISPKSCIIIIP